MAWAVYCGLAVLGIVQGAISLLTGIRSWLFARKDLRGPLRAPSEPATVILPCRGAEPSLARTVALLLAQEHPDYEVLFVVESAGDAACPVIRAGIMAAGRGGPPAKLIVAGVGAGRSRKVHNLLAGVAAARPKTTVLVFADSDAIPAPLHLARLVARLHKPDIGATTGYRWYVPSGGLVQAVCSVWNAAPLALLGSHGSNFCWGGAMAVRRDVFEQIGVPQRWHGALSDDYQMTRCVREAGLGIRFVPGCVVSTLGPSRWGEFLRFAHRQFVITRICGPRLWALATGMCALYCGLILTGAVAAVRLGWHPPAWSAAHAHDRAMVGVAGLLLLLGGAKSIVRHLLVRRVVPRSADRRGALSADVLLSPLVAFINLGLLTSSMLTRRVHWRGTTYEMISADETRVLENERPLPFTVAEPRPADELPVARHVGR